MRTKTFTGPSIQAALKKARYALGDDVVLLESVPAQQGAAARIRVMADTPLSDARSPAPTRSTPDASSGASSDASSGASSDASPGASSASAPAASSATTARQLSGYGPRLATASTTTTDSPPRSAWRRSTEGSAVERRENVSERPDLTAYLERRREAARAQQASPPATGDGAVADPPPDAPPAADPAARTDAGRNRLYPVQPASPPPAGYDNDLTAARPNQFTASSRSDDAPARLLESHLQMLHARLENMERRFGGIIVGASHRWITHPLYAQLLEKGLRPSTITKLFDRLVERGFEPQENDEELRWAMAQELRRMLSATAPKRSNANYLFIGPSGAGKTSLLLKLARHESFFGRRLPTVIAIMPEDDTLPYLSPVPLYREYGLPVQNVRTEREMQAALNRVQQFDQVLIDTPPLPVDPDAARPVLRRLQRIVRPLMPLQVHLTLNVTRTFDDLSDQLLERLPFTPDAVALTHLDEATKWGRIAEWLLMLDKPVHFVSTGRRVPEGVEAFTPSWFVEEMMQL